MMMIQMMGDENDGPKQKRLKPTSLNLICTGYIDENDCFWLPWALLFHLMLIEAAKMLMMVWDNEDESRVFANVHEKANFYPVIRYKVPS